MHSGCLCIQAATLCIQVLLVMLRGSKRFRVAGCVAWIARNTVRECCVSACRSHNEHSMRMACMRMPPRGVRVASA